MTCGRVRFVEARSEAWHDMARSGQARLGMAGSGKVSGKSGLAEVGSDEVGSEASHGEPGFGRASFGMVRSVATRGRALSGLLGCDTVRSADGLGRQWQCESWQGQRLGMARSGQAMYGTLMQCWACLGITRQGQRYGTAWRGEAWRCQACSGTVIFYSNKTLWKKQRH